MNSEMLDRLEVWRRNTLKLSNNADQVDLDLLINARRDYRLALDAALPELLSAAREGAALKAELAAAKTQPKEVCVVTHVQDGEIKESKVFADRKAGIAYWLELSEAKAQGDNDDFTDDDELRISVEEVAYPDTAPSTPEGE